MTKQSSNLSTAKSADNSVQEEASPKPIFALADRLTKLLARKKEIDQMWKSVNAEIETVNEMLTAEMVNNELQNFKRNNITYYLQTQYFASIVAEESAQDQLFDNLRKEGFGDIIKETINPQTLKAFVKEQITTSDEGELPEYMRGLVNVYTKDKVNTRRS